MPGIARVGDMTIGICDHGFDCCPHTCIGYHVQGSGNVNINNRGAINAPGSLTIHNCPHCGMGITITGQERSKINNKYSHRCGDQINEICGSGVTITCSENLNTI